MYNFPHFTVNCRLVIHDGRRFVDIGELTDLCVLDGGQAYNSTLEHSCAFVVR